LAGWLGVRVPAFFFSRNAQTCSAVHPSHLFIGYLGSFPGLTWPGRKVDHSLHLGPGSRMSGAIRLRPLYAFMVWTGKTTIFHFPSKNLRISTRLHEATIKSDGTFSFVLQNHNIFSALLLLLLLLVML